MCLKEDLWSDGDDAHSDDSEIRFLKSVVAANPQLF